MRKIVVFIGVVLLIALPLPTRELYPSVFADSVVRILPLPPLGWEERLTPGFTPSVEETLVMEYSATKEEMQKHVSAWGANAAPLLRRLYQDPAWSDYSAKIREYLKQYGLSDSELDIRKRFEYFLTLPELERTDFDEFRTILEILARDDMPFLKRTVMRRADETSMGTFYLIVSTLQKSPSTEMIEFLEALSQSEDSDNERQYIAYTVERMKSRLRAQEPMAQLKSRQSVEEGANEDAHN